MSIIERNKRSINFKYLSICRNYILGNAPIQFKKTCLCKGGGGVIKPLPSKSAHNLIFSVFSMSSSCSNIKPRVLSEHGAITLHSRWVWFGKKKHCWNTLLLKDVINVVFTLFVSFFLIRLFLWNPAPATTAEKGLNWSAKDTADGSHTFTNKEF